MDDDEDDDEDDDDEEEEEDDDDDEEDDRMKTGTTRNTRSGRTRMRRKRTTRTRKASEEDEAPDKTGEWDDDYIDYDTDDTITKIELSAERGAERLGPSPRFRRDDGRRRVRLSCRQQALLRTKTSD